MVPRLILFLMLFSLIGELSFAQIHPFSGKIIESFSHEPIEGVSVEIEELELITLTDENGEFRFEQGLSSGEFVLLVYKDGFLSQKFSISLNPGEVNEPLIILLILDQSSLQEQMVHLTDEQLDDDEGTAFNVSGLLQASRDGFLNAAAFDFSSTFFRPRGYDSRNGKVLINGLEMNKIWDGRPHWASWGGLNDVQRNQRFSMGMAPNEYTFGDLAGTTHISMRASEYRKGGRISYAIANKTYTGRIMGSYSSGLTKSGWAYSFLLSRRFATEGFKEGTPYDANSFFASVEKKINDFHSLNLTAFYTPVKRGKASANTQEVYDLKGIRYNSYWGKQDGKIRNSRMREVEEPTFILSHFWKVSEKLEINSNVGFQTGHIANSRLGYDKAPNPDPAYYQKLPSYFLAETGGPNYEGAYRAYSSFVQDGQIDWEGIYETNILYGGTSRYYLYDDRNDDDLWMGSILVHSPLTERFTLNGGLNLRNLSTHHYAKMKDLLGGNGYLDIDTFKKGEQAQNDLNHPDRMVQVGDAFKYNYELFAKEINGFVQGEYSFSRMDLYIAGKAGSTSYQRNGLYRNGSYPDDNDSFGKSENLKFITYGIKGGITYRLSGKHALEINGNYFTNPPYLRNSFSNVRQNNKTVIGLKEEKFLGIDGSYYYRTPFVKIRLTGYYTQLEDASEISFFYADGISVQGQSAKTAFIQEVLADIDKRNTGLEIGIESQVTPTVKLKGAAGYGEHIYANNPELYLTSDDFKGPAFFGKSHLKNYKVAGGPQQAYQLGFEYRDPEYWWFGITANYFSNAYINISPLLRTKNFYLDIDGLPYDDYDPAVARKLLKQEKFDSYFLVNVVGGKSWRIRSYYIGFFAAINNAFDKEYKTGGFEQGRNADYRTLSKDVSHPVRVFGPKYWYGYGASYYLNVYLRF